MATGQLFALTGPTSIKGWSDSAAPGAVAVFDANGNLNPNKAVGAIQATNGLQLSVASTQTSSFSISVGASGNSVIQPMDATSGVLTATLPLAASVPNSVVILKKLDAAHNITVARTGSDTIDGATSATMSTQWGVLRLYSDGSNWFTF